jgi:hypothetical protein
MAEVLLSTFVPCDDIIPITVCVRSCGSATQSRDCGKTQAAALSFKAPKSDSEFTSIIHLRLLSWEKLKKKKNE